MKKYLGIVLVGAIAAFGVGCTDESSDSSGTGGNGTGATGGDGTGGTGTGGTGGVVDPGPCSDEDENAILITDEEITADTTWDRADCDYVLTRIVYVVGATLTIEPGVTVKGDIGSALIIARGSQIIAEGTADAPIVMTSSRAVGARNTGDWGGLALLGEATINRGLGTCGGDTGTVCEDNLEGLPAQEGRAIFGGDDDASSCGSLEYVRIEFAGNEIAPNNELNGLTLGGCGSGTNLDFIQVHRGLDDGVEFFGGTASISHVIVDGMGDDGIDWDQGYTGTVSKFISHHYAGRTDDPRGIEADNFGTETSITPRSAPTVEFGTVVANTGASHDQGIVLRRGTWGNLTGIVVFNFDTNSGIDIRDDGWDGADGGWPNELSVTMSCFDSNDPNFPVDDNDESTENPGTFFDEDVEIPGAGNLAEDPQMGNYAVAADGDTPDYSVGNSNCMGAFAEDGMDWTQGWTAYPVN
jgi:hypothetical protein